jgi:transcriptional regulator GlxA family with amidase domain
LDGAGASTDLIDQLLQAVPNDLEGRDRATVQGIALTAIGGLIGRLGKRRLAEACAGTTSECPTIAKMAVGRRSIASLSTVWRHPKVVAAVGFLEGNYSNPRLRLSAAARHVALSESHLDRLLKRDTGRTFVEHLRLLRVRNASGLLGRTTLSIKEVAALSGYDHTSSFDRDFKRIHGCTPTTFRLRACEPRS